MKEHLKKLTDENQISMETAVLSVFSSSELENMKVMIRITIEFHDFLQHGPSDFKDIVVASEDGNPSIAICAGRQADKYVCDTIWVWMDEFRTVNDAYNVLVGATE